MKKERKLMGILIISISLNILWSMMLCGAASTNLGLQKEVDKFDVQLRIVNSNFEKMETLYKQQEVRHEKEMEEQKTMYLDALHKTRDWKELVNTMQGEAGGQGVIGIELCTNTVINRIAMNHWGNTIHDVVSAPGQYDAYGVTYDEINPDVIAGVDKVLLYGPTNEAIFYMNPETSSVSSRGWMRTKPFILKYKDHEFYGE